MVSRQALAFSSFRIYFSYRKASCLRSCPSQGNFHPVTEWSRDIKTRSIQQIAMQHWWESFTPELSFRLLRFCWVSSQSHQLLPLPNPASFPLFHKYRSLLNILHPHFVSAFTSREASLQYSLFTCLCYYFCAISVQHGNWLCIGYCLQRLSVFLCTKNVWH